MTLCQGIQADNLAAFTYIYAHPTHLAFVEHISPNRKGRAIEFEESSNIYL